MRNRLVLLLIAVLLSAPTVGARLGLPPPASATLEATAKATIDAPEPPSPPPPPEPPTIPALLGAWAHATIGQDLAGAEVSGAIVVRGTAQAEEGFTLQSVAIHVDRAYVGRAEGTDEWSYALDTRLLVDGPHQVQACGLAAVSGIPNLMTGGACATLRFSTLNHAPALLLFERTIDVQGAMAEAWTYVLDRDVTGLRVTFEYEAACTPAVPPRGMLEVARHRLPGEDPAEAPLDGWFATYGELEGSASWTRSPGLVVRQPAALALSGEFVGQGRFTVRVEAVPVAPDV